MANNEPSARPMPDLDALAAFEAVARLRSFRGAALERNVAPSTLSETVRALEDRLGLRLLNRTTRSVSPTEAGATLLERLRPALAEVAGALDGVALLAERVHGTLRINAPPPAAQLVLAPLLARFHRLHPGIQLEIVTDSAFVDIVEAGFDAGVRWGEHLAPGMVAVPLTRASQRMVVAAAPALLSEVGIPAHPRELLTRPCLRHRFTSGALLPWEFERDGESLSLSPSGPLTTTSGPVAIRAAVDGLGFLYSFDELIGPELTSGALELVLEPWCAPFPGPSLYYPTRRLMPAPLRAFVDFVAADRTLTDTAPWPPPAPPSR